MSSNYKELRKKLNGKGAGSVLQIEKSFNSSKVYYSSEQMQYILEPMEKNVELVKEAQEMLNAASFLEKVSVGLFGVNLIFVIPSLIIQYVAGLKYPNLTLKCFVSINTIE